MAELVDRSASLSDFREIWSLLRDVATDVPFDVDNEAVQENVLSEVMACCTAGQSPVVVGPDQQIVGALLLRRDDFDWGLFNGNALHVSYAAIAPSFKDKGVFQALMARAKESKVPIYVSVKSGNQSGLADAIKALGFVHECAAANGWGDLYKWRPPVGH